MKFLSFAFSLFAILCWNTALSQSTHTPLRNGDWAYDRAQYKAAEKHYRAAADRDMGNPQAVYNLGNALYQQGNFEDAEQRFRQAANSAKIMEHRADALHNLGDAYLKQRKNKEAVQSYIESLRLRPGDTGTKQNLQMAKKQLREEEKREKEKQQKDQEQQQNQNQDQQQSPQNQEEKQQNQPSQPQQNQQGQPQKPQGEQQKKMEEQRLKKEDAKRLLETAVGPDDRKNAKKYRAAQQQSKPKSPKKDW